MREIKFRGKAYRRWVYGGLVYSDNIEPAIYFEVGNKVYKRMDWAYVDPATVGQFTGLTDKNGKEIYEGDVITFYVSLKKVNGEFVEDIRKTVVEWDGAGFNIASLSKITHTVKVIGNIHDNPELLKGGMK